MCLTSDDRQRTDFLAQALLAQLDANFADSDLLHEAKGLDWKGVIAKYSDHTLEADRIKTKESWFRDKLRKGESFAEGLHTLTDMIPDEKGLSVLKTGLAFTFMVSLYMKIPAPNL